MRSASIGYDSKSRGYFRPPSSNKSQYRDSRSEKLTAKRKTRILISKKFQIPRHERAPLPKTPPRTPWKRRRLLAGKEEPCPVSLCHDLLVLIRKHGFRERDASSSLSHDPLSSQRSFDVRSEETDLHLHRRKVLFWRYRGRNGYSHSGIRDIGHYSSVHG